MYRRPQPEAGCGRRYIVSGEVFGQEPEVRIAGMTDGGGEIDLAVTARAPASGGRSATRVTRESEVVLLAISQGGVRLQERSHWNGRIGMIPARGQQATRMRVEQQKRNVAAGEVAGQGLDCRLRKE